MLEDEEAAASKDDTTDGARSPTEGWAAARRLNGMPLWMDGSKLISCCR